MTKDHVPVPVPHSGGAAYDSGRKRYRNKSAASTIIISTICTVASTKWGWGMGGGGVESMDFFAVLYFFIFISIHFYSLYLLHVHFLYYHTPDFDCDVNDHYLATFLKLFLTIFPRTQYTLSFFFTYLYISLFLWSSSSWPSLLRSLLGSVWLMQETLSVLWGPQVFVHGLMEHKRNLPL